MEAKYLVFIGLIFQGVGTLRYAYLTAKGRVQPNKITWLIWAIIPMIAAVAAWNDGARFTAVPVFASGFFPLIVFSVSFFNKDAYWKIGKFDYICGILSVITILFWLIVTEPIITIILAIIADAIAFIPTIKKTISFPDSENYSSYLGAIISGSLGLFAVENWVFSEYGFLIYIIAICSVMVFLITQKAKV